MSSVKDRVAKLNNNYGGEDLKSLKQRPLPPAPAVQTYSPAASDGERITSPKYVKANYATTNNSTLGGNTAVMSLQNESYSRQRDFSAVHVLGPDVAKNATSINWKYASGALFLSVLANVAYFISLGTVLVTIDNRPLREGNPLFDGAHKTMFIWGIIMITVYSGLSARLVFDKAWRAERNIGMVQAFGFVVFNLTLMLVTHNGTFLEFDSCKINTIYVGPPVLFFQLMLLLCLFGVFGGSGGNTKEDPIYQY